VNWSIHLLSTVIRVAKVLKLSHYRLTGGRGGFADVCLDGLGGMDLSDDDDVHGYLFSAHFRFSVGFRGTEVKKLRTENEIINFSVRNYQVVFLYSPKNMSAQVDVCYASAELAGSYLYRP
jgi:hypothetical protein